VDGRAYHTGSDKEDAMEENEPPKRPDGSSSGSGTAPGWSSGSSTKSPRRRQ
jgi:hypothetical protein